MHDLTKGSIARNLLQTTSFMLVGMVFQTLYFLVDLYFVGRLGKSAVAAVSLAGNLMFLVLALTQMLGVGTTALIAHATGRKDQDEARLIFNQSQVLSLLVGLVFFVVMMALRGRFARAQPRMRRRPRLAGEYLAWFIPALAAQFAMIATAAALRGTGRLQTRDGDAVGDRAAEHRAGTGADVRLDLGPSAGRGRHRDRVVRRGRRRCAWVDRLRGAQAGLPAVRSRQWRPRLALWGRMLAIGLPAGAEFALMGVYMFVVYAITRRFGAEAQAGFGIGLRVIQAGFMPVVALGFAVSPVAGQNFGARRPERVRATFRVAALMATVAMVALFVICRAVPERLVAVFNADPAVLAVGGEYLRIVAWNFIPSGIVFVSSSMFQALGNTIPPLASSLVRTSLLVIPSYLMSFAPGFALHWIWYLSAGCVAFHGFLNVVLLRREYRRKLAFAEPAVVPSYATSA